jgi:hypothetical protein
MPLSLPTLPFVLYQISDLFKHRSEVETVPSVRELLMIQQLTHDLDRKPGNRTPDDVI